MAVSCVVIYPDVVQMLSPVCLCFQLTDEIAQLSERISSDRPNMERVARAVRELIQAAGTT